jgi:hypothetical protein
MQSDRRRSRHNQSYARRYSPRQGEGWKQRGAAEVKVTILNHPEFGQTLTRADGISIWPLTAADY